MNYLKKTLFLFALLAMMSTMRLSIGLVEAQDSSTVNPHYAALLNNSMWFYEAQRSGKLPSNNRVPWRHTSVEDEQDQNHDLSGGYYDAGDYMKFTLPLAHSLTLISWGGMEWYDGYTRANQSGYLQSTIRWGTDWLLKAHPDANTLYVQVGSGKIDNNYWGPDTGIPTPRPSYAITNTATGTDVAAMTAAALASASSFFRQMGNDTTYATTLLNAAQSVFALAETQPFQTYTKAVPEADNLYQTNKYSSQLVYGALWLYKASGNSDYRGKASHYYDQFNLGETRSVIPMDWADCSGAVSILVYHAATRWLDTMIDPSSSSASSSPCMFTKGGMLWCDGYSDSNSMVPLQDTALLALLYSRLHPPKSKQYTEFATKQIEYMLGNNYMMTPYVCGVHMNSPHNPHHAGASGGTDIGKIDTSPPEELYILYGAVVGGPNKEDLFYDERSDWKQTEVALDYNAPFQGLVAYQISTNAADPPYVTITSPRPSVYRSFVFPGWLLAAIIVVVVFILAGIGYCLWLKRHGLKQRWGGPKAYQV
ncbi:Six-hairpin glycosidase-like protein [Absidia repens]|uniref:Endoglucanase n=1 Tax=Absidia repens TaxID=90262 RepID=A0A1X2IXU4_9FUNG|nr:Six-hairpin glycosidase-like protein [Absidia repens]